MWTAISNLMVVYCKNASTRSVKMPHVVRAYVPGHSIATVYVLLRSSVHAYQSFIIRENIFSGYNSAHDFAHLFDVDTIERDVVVLEPEKIRVGFSFAALQILDIIMHWAAFLGGHKPFHFEKKKDSVRNHHQLSGVVGGMNQAPFSFLIFGQHQFAGRLTRV